MTDQAPEVKRERRKADRRGGGRRRGDRLVEFMPSGRQLAVGGIAFLGAVVILRMLLAGDDSPGPVLVEEVAGAPGVDALAAGPQAAAATREAFTVAEFEGLLAEGAAAVGQTIRTELYCGSIMQVSVRSSGSMNPALAELVDSDGRVAGAECRWGRDSQSSEFLLVIPPALAADFARAPEEELSFVTRRRIPAELEWLGRSPELALRNAGILQLILI